MWALLILGGAILVNVVAPISVGLEDSSQLLLSSIKAAIAVVLVVIWIIVLTLLKNWIFKKQIA